MLREGGWWREGKGRGMLKGRGNEKEKGDGEGKGLPGPSSPFVDGPGPSSLSSRVCPGRVVIGPCCLIVITCVVVMSWLGHVTCVVVMLWLGHVASSLSSHVWLCHRCALSSWSCHCAVSSSLPSHVVSPSSSSVWARWVGRNRGWGVLTMVS